MLGAAAVLTLLTTACGSSSDKPAASGASGGTTKMTIGIPANSAASAFLQLAVTSGLTKKYGLDVTLDSSVPPANTPAALVSGSISASALTSAATMARAKGIPVVNVLATATHAPFVMLAGPGITTLGQLAGKTVVTSAPTDAPGTETNEILKNAGIASSVKVLGVGTVPGRSALFISKQADAIYEALNLALKDQEKRPGSTIIADNGSIPTTASDGIAVTQSYLAKNRPQVLALVKACLEAVNMLKNNPDQAAPFMEKVYNLNADEFAQFVKFQKDSIDITGQPDPAEFQNQATLFAGQPSAGGTKVNWTSDLVKQSWDTTVAADAAAALGYAK